MGFRKQHGLHNRGPNMDAIFDAKSRSKRAPKSIENLKKRVPENDEFSDALPEAIFSILGSKMVPKST